VGNPLVALDTEEKPAEEAGKRPAPQTPPRPVPKPSESARPERAREAPPSPPAAWETPKTTRPPEGTPLPDFSRWGPIQKIPVSSLRRKIGENVLHSWTTIPHVHQFHEADITDLEALRKRHAGAFSEKGIRLTLTAFLLKALVRALQAYPQFNATLDPGSDELIQKRYYHIGVAVDTESGLIVPVLRDVDRKGLPDLARELAEISEKTRERKISPEELQGGTFSLSNLGGIGGSHFTPIIRSPEVAVLGVGRTQERLVLRNGTPVPRLYLPICLAYDHRVIDGADGARFISHLADSLENHETLLLGI
jgi:pyruvate dehydrogenase E2 component (dihydrolipoamide acetyltransferase)